MLLRNVNMEKGLCKGIQLVVTNLAKNLISCTVLTGSAEGNFVFIPRIDLVPHHPDMPFVLRRRQFSVKLAFPIMIITKAHGHTLTKVGVFFHNVFLAMDNSTWRFPGSALLKMLRCWSYKMKIREAHTRDQ